MSQIDSLTLNTKPIVLLHDFVGCKLNQMLNFCLTASLEAIMDILIISSRRHRDTMYLRYRCLL